MPNPTQILFEDFPGRGFRIIPIAAKMLESVLCSAIIYGVLRWGIKMEY
ncbi:MAG: hypothetical protein HC825_01760 [Oscillatoriales cyanobacterium RM1_1_9]|nr:hypothetical protein [Oscillatoriales cyanobacterium RM1_1_9]